MISPSLLALVGPLADRFTAAGHELFLVGGIVRDELIAPGRSAWVDVDLTTDARPEQIQRLVEPMASAVWTQGARFGTIGCRIDGTPFEITTYRGDVYNPGSRKPAVSFSNSLVDDLARRDFTVNAIAADARDGTLHDPFDGRGDLVSRMLRTPIGADTSFSDDPLRMLRAARFLARFDLEPAADIDGAITRCLDRLVIVSAERVRDELHKLLAVADPTRGLRFLVDHRLVERWLPELARLAGVHDLDDGGTDALTHSLDVVRRCSRDIVLRMAALLHDLAKVDVGPAEHATRGAVLVGERLRALRHGNDEVRAITQLVGLHHRLDRHPDGWAAPEVRRVLVDAGPQLERLVALAEANIGARADAAVAARRIASWRGFIAARDALGETAAQQQPELDGAEVMRILRVPQGPIIGQAQEFLRELRIARGAIGHEAAATALREWYRSQER